MKKHKSRRFFELRRRLDGLVYEFDLTPRNDGGTGYKRRDQDLWINRHGKYGWIAWDGVSETIHGRPWYSLPEDQLDFPPEGVWVSMKNEKSYVYDLVYSNVE